MEVDEQLPSGPEHKTAAMAKMSSSSSSSSTSPLGERREEELEGEEVRVEGSWRPGCFAARTPLWPRCA